MTLSKGEDHEISDGVQHGSAAAEVTAGVASKAVARAHQDLLRLLARQIAEDWIAMHAATRPVDAAAANGSRP
jgi:hypothetical protein